MNKQADRLSQHNYASLLEQAINVFGDKEKAVLWFETPIRALSGDTPMSRLDTEVGRQQIHEIINKIKYGGFS